MYNWEYPAITAWERTTNNLETQVVVDIILTGNSVCNLKLVEVVTQPVSFTVQLQHHIKYSYNPSICFHLTTIENIALCAQEIRDYAEVSRLYVGLNTPLDLLSWPKPLITSVGCTEVSSAPSLLNLSYIYPVSSDDVLENITDILVPGAKIQSCLQKNMHFSS